MKCHKTCLVGLVPCLSVQPLLGCPLFTNTAAFVDKAADAVYMTSYALYGVPLMTMAISVDRPLALLLGGDANKL